LSANLASEKAGLSLIAERMSNMLTARQLLILETIIHFYTTDEEAVGSKKIAELTNIDASPATIRNEMSVLKKNGFIQKTHFSSGRIPSLIGYRFYVDHLMQPKRLSRAQLEKISNKLSNQVKQVDDIINQSAKILSDLTNYTAIVLGPQAENSRLTGFRLVTLSENQIMAILQTDKNIVESLVFKVSNQVSSSDIQKITRIFNEHLVGDTLIEVYEKLQSNIPLLVNKYASSASNILVSIESALNKIQENQVHVSGKTNIFDFSENMNTEQIKSLFDLLDNENANLNYLMKYINKDINIKIGDELNDVLFQNLSLVTANYKVAGFGTGVIAIIGPTSMPYSKTLGAMESFRGELGKAILKYYLE